MDSMTLSWPTLTVAGHTDKPRLLKIIITMRRIDLEKTKNMCQWNWERNASLGDGVGGGDEDQAPWDEEVSRSRNQKWVQVVEVGSGLCAK